MSSTRFRFTKLWSILAATFVVATLSPRAHALEAKGDLNVELRLLQTVPGRTTSGPTASGVARIEVTVDAYRVTRDIALRIERPDGRVWTVQGKAISMSPPVWTDAGGEPQEPGANGPTVPARGLIRTTIEVPLEGAAVHEIVVRVLGTSVNGTLSTEAVVMAPLGVQPNLPVDDGTFATFSLQGVN